MSNVNEQYNGCANRDSWEAFRIVFDPADPLKPLIIETDREVQGEYKAVLMPIRDSKSSACAKAFQESDEQEGAA